MYYHHHFVNVHFKAVKMQKFKKTQTDQQVQLSYVYFTETNATGKK